MGTPSTILTTSGDAGYYERLPKGRKKEIDRPQGEFYATDVFNEYAVEFIKQGRQRDKPWFLFLGHSSPHFPVQAPPESADKYFDRYLRGWDVLREERYARMQKIGLIDGKRWTFTDRSLVPVDRDDIANGFSGKPNPPWNSIDEPRQKDLARRMALFAASVDHVDQGIGKIIEHLKETGELEKHHHHAHERQRRLLRVGAVWVRPPEPRGLYQAPHR